MKALYFLLCAIALLSHNPHIACARKLESSPQQRRHAVDAMFGRLQAEYGYGRHDRRRLLNLTNGDAERVLLSWAYNFDLAKQSQMLRGLGVTESDGLPPEIGDTHLTQDYFTATEALAKFITDEEKASKKRRLKTEKSGSSLDDVLPPTQQTVKPRYLREVSPGVHEIDISGAYISSDKQKNDAGRKLTSSAMSFGGTCQEVPLGDVYVDQFLDGISGTQACTCNSDGIQEPRALSIGLVTVNMKQRWCKCRETAGLFGATEHYAYVGYKCTQVSFYISTSGNLPYH